MKRESIPVGWRSRGYLPHFDSRCVVQHVTYRLADSLPADVVAQIEAALKVVPSDRQQVERRMRIEDWIDRGLGSCLLGEPAAARMVQQSFLHFDGERYRLLAWLVMPNHVHVLFHTLGEWTMSRIVASWKSYTGRRLSLGPPRSSVALPRHRVWHREYWDRFIRDELHFQVAREYIHQNPVKAGLVRRVEDWEWSSARRSGGG